MVQGEKSRQGCFDLLLFKNQTPPCSNLLPCAIPSPELPPRQTPLRTVAPVQRRKTSMFEDAEGDDLLDVLRRGKGPKKE